MRTRFFLLSLFVGHWVQLPHAISEWIPLAYLTPPDLSLGAPAFIHSKFPLYCHWPTWDMILEMWKIQPFIKNGSKQSRHCNFKITFLCVALMGFKELSDSRKYKHLCKWLFKFSKSIYPRYPWFSFFFFFFFVKPSLYWCHVSRPSWSLLLYHLSQWWAHYLASLMDSSCILSAPNPR